MGKEDCALQIGQRFEYRRIVAVKDGSRKETKKQTGVVTDLYRYIFRARMDGHDYYECFPYSLLEATDTEMIRLL